jgi:cellulose synthase/poly-beta-1,6-N-acetylglucosamine synthase-like glycosyltransferase
MITSFDMLDYAGATSLLLLSFTWMGYPLLAHAMARFSRWPSYPSTRPFRRVSVVISTRDEPELVDAKIASVLSSKYPVELLEVIVAFDWDYYRDLPALANACDGRVRCVIGDTPGGKAAALNAGVREATGEVLVLTDTRQMLEPGAILELIRVLSDESVGAVSGKLELRAQEPTSLISRYWSMERSLRLAEARWHSAVGVSGALYAMRRALWKPLPSGLILDDLYVPMQVVLHGKRVGFCPAAIASETRRTTPALEYHRKVRTLAGNVQLCMWLPSVLSPRRNPIWMQFVAHKLLRLTTPVLCGVVVVWFIVLLASALPFTQFVSLAVGFAILASLAWAPKGTLRSVREASVWMAYMLKASTVGLALGLRRRWDVWE